MISSILISLARFIVMALTDAAMIPALLVMQRNRRHFELFIGCFHLIISFIFNISGAWGVNIFLSELEWHFISDVLSITYALVLCVHLMGLPNENQNILLRYLAFALTWIMKVKDQWDSTLFETILIAIYAIMVLIRHFTPPTKPGDKISLNADHATKAVISLAMLGLVYLVSESTFVESDPLSIIYGLYHIIAGALFYYAWLSVPCRDTWKKSDDYLLPQHGNGSFV